MDKGTQGRLLVIEDNRDIADMVCDYLEQLDYTIDYAADGISGLHLAVTHNHDLIVLDLMLPGLDGLELLRQFRTRARDDTPILILSARDTLNDKIAGLDAGADDYLLKPFEIQELEARIRALIRRNRGQVSPRMMTVGDLSFDTGTLEVSRNGQKLKLTPIGIKILHILMQASPRVVQRREIEEQIWGDLLPDSDTLRSHMYNLRKEIDKPFDKQLMHTIQNAGYKIADIDQ
jgi:DNA-binding response OmpR family regulator